MDFKAQFKSKSVGWYITTAATLIALVTMIIYIAFGVSAHAFHAGVFVCLLFAVLFGVATFFYDGAFSEFFGVAIVALLMASFGMLAADSVRDFADYITQIQLYGNMNNAPLRLTILIFTLISVVTAIVGCFFKSVKNKEQAA